MDFCGALVLNVDGRTLTIIPEWYVKGDAYALWLNEGTPDGRHLDHLYAAIDHFKESYGFEGRVGEVLVVPNQVYRTLSHKVSTGKSASLSFL